MRAWRQNGRWSAECFSQTSDVQFASQFVCLAPFMDLQVKLFILSVSFLVDVHNLCLELACVHADKMAFSFAPKEELCLLYPCF
jgi:hypothetical protein